VNYLSHNMHSAVLESYVISLNELLQYLYAYFLIEDYNTLSFILNDLIISMAPLN